MDEIEKQIPLFNKNKDRPALLSPYMCIFYSQQCQSIKVNLIDSQILDHCVIK